MALNDARSDQLVVNSIQIAAKTNGTANGSGVDLARGHNATFHFLVGTVTDGTHTPKLQDSADNSVFNDVVAGDQGGTLANLATNVHQKVAYLGNKRYVRAVITTSGATTGA